MTRIPLVAGNWKMNGTGEEALSLIEAMLPELMEMKDVERVVCPPFTALHIVSQRLAGSDIQVGAQNMYWEDSGAFTGEVSPLMVKQYCKYVIIGHSERRAMFGETDNTVNKRILSALSHDLIPIICVGETLDERESGMTENVVQHQVHLALRDVQVNPPSQIVIAYEPVWAIGTGRAATAEDANAVIEGSIRTILKQDLGESIRESTRILYGGSVKSDNAREFFIQAEIDGALVGGASLKARDFVEIVRAARI